MGKAYDDSEIDRILSSAACGEDVDPHADTPNWIRSKACCCPSRAAVKVVIPHPKEQSRTTDLLLCQHHFRASRGRLTEMSAIAFDAQGHLM